MGSDTLGESHEPNDVGTLISHLTLTLTIIFAQLSHIDTMSPLMTRGHAYMYEHDYLAYLHNE